MPLNESVSTVSSAPSNEAVAHCAHFACTQALELFDENNPLCLDSGQVLAPVRVAYQTWGRLNQRGDNAILICHALTAGAHAWSTPGCSDQLKGWWDGLIGPGKCLDPNRYFLICTNVLGSCYGTTGPVSPCESDNRPLGMRFPQITIRDMVRLQHKLMQELGIRSLAAVIGGSVGGFQVLEWGLMYPEFAKTLIPIATTGQHRPWATAFNEIARQAIQSDPEWNDGAYNQQPSKGLALARMGALISYRHHRSYARKFAASPGTDKATAQDKPVSSYLNYQGDKFHRRFDANTYLRLIEAMDSHDLGRDRGGLENALSSLKQPTLWLAFDSDELYPVDEQWGDARRVSNARFVQLSSHEGHDAFLIEFEHLSRPLNSFLAEHYSNNQPHREVAS